jgi:thiamine-phosphate diphosphorylase
MRHSLSGTNQLYLITDGSARAENYSESRSRILSNVRAAVDESIAYIQLREKQLPARHLFELAAEAASLTARSQTKLLVNERADIAIAVGADGVHLPSAAIDAATVRRILPTGSVIGVSAHTFEQASDAVAACADLLILGPVFATPGKDRVLGVSNLNEICRRLPEAKIIAVGGIDAGNFREVLGAGAAGVAAIRALGSPNAIREFAAAFRNSRTV